MRIAFLLAVAALAMTSTAEAATLSTLYAFCSEGDCADGANPLHGLIADAAGNLYGTTVNGGSMGRGAIFEIARHGTRWKHRTLYSFCVQASCADGEQPQAALVMGADGSLYGTASAGGRNLSGIAFKLSPRRHADWKLSVLYDFCPVGAPSDGTPICLDGMRPTGRLAYAGQASGTAYDGTSPLYGSADGGARGGGVLFALTPGGSQSVLHDFCLADDCRDGRNVRFNMWVDGTGNIFGATGEGGAHGGGTVFELSPGSGGGWTLTTLYDFCSLAQCIDGREPLATPVMDAGGNLYGTTGKGGAHKKGTLFKLAPVGGDWQESVLHDFCDEKPCPDGNEPGQVVLDPSERVLGTTFFGKAGNANGGVVFSWDGAYHVLYDFCSTEKKCRDGRFPMGPLVPDADGHVFGVATYGGGHGNGGTVFELTP